MESSARSLRRRPSLSSLFGSSSHPELDLSRVHDFFTDGVGPSILDNHEPTSGRATPASESTRSVVTINLADTAKRGTMQFPLHDFLEDVEAHAFLKGARITKVSRYSQRARLVKFPSLILELKQEGKENIFMRLDKQLPPSSMVSGLLRTSAKTTPYQTARLAGSASNLVRDAKKQNIVDLWSPPMLSTLRDLIFAVSAETANYTEWPENAEIFCSVIQQYLTGVGGGVVQSGSLIHSDLASTLEDRVRARLQYEQSMRELAALPTTECPALPAIPQSSLSLDMFRSLQTPPHSPTAAVSFPTIPVATLTADADHDSDRVSLRSVPSISSEGHMDETGHGSGVQINMTDGPVSSVTPNVPLTQLRHLLPGATYTTRDSGIWSQYACSSIHEFFTENGKMILEGVGRFRSMTGATAKSSATLAEHATYQISLDSLFEQIQEYPFLGSTTIVAMSCFIDLAAVGSDSHSIILQLRRAGKQDVYLTLKRLHPDAPGTDRADDMVHVASTLADLSFGNKEVKSLTLDPPVVLKGFRAFLSAMRVELAMYKVPFEEARLMFNNLVREFFEDHTGYGQGPDIRARVRKCYQVMLQSEIHSSEPYHTPEPLKPPCVSSHSSGRSALRSKHDSDAPPNKVVPPPAVRYDSCPPQVILVDANSAPSKRRTGARSSCLSRRPITHTSTSISMLGSYRGSKALDALPFPSYANGVALQVPIPCLISSKGATFWAYVRYAGELRGEEGPWLGIIVPGAKAAKLDRADWSDGSVGGVTYFDVDDDAGSRPIETLGLRRQNSKESNGRLSDVRCPTPSSSTSSKSRGRRQREGPFDIAGLEVPRPPSAALSGTSASKNRGLFVRPAQVVWVSDPV